MRRMFLTLVRWIEHNMNDLVFEPNKPAVVGAGKGQARGYCYELFQRGALKGRDPGGSLFRQMRRGDQSIGSAGSRASYL